MNELSLQSAPEKHAEFQVICLCAAWCGSCRSYRPKFERFAADYPSVRFLWVDIEEHADALGELDIENFPTLLIRRQSVILYFGIIEPRRNHLRRLLENFMEQSADQLNAYVLSNEERRAWQENRTLIELLSTPSFSPPKEDLAL